MPCYSITNPARVAQHPEAGTIYQVGCTGKGTSDLHWVDQTGKRIDMATQQVQLTPQQQNAQAIVGGATQILNTVSTQLNSQPITALSTSAAQALPATPWGALPAQGAQPLAVINPNQFQYPVVYAQPFYKNVWLMAGVIGGLGLVGFTLFKLRPRRR